MDAIAAFRMWRAGISSLEPAVARLQTPGLVKLRPLRPQNAPYSLRELPNPRPEGTGLPLARFFQDQPASGGSVEALEHGDGKLGQ